jgi:uroporphyrinogen-III decarboxylase
LINDFTEAGFDILNPLQFSAAGMDPLEIKREFGDQITFWGGGVDTQHTLPFGTPEEIRREIRERIQILSSGGGYVFSTIHNIQPLIPLENLMALIETINEFRR